MIENGKQYHNIPDDGFAHAVVAVKWMAFGIALLVCGAFALEALL